MTRDMAGRGGGTSSAMDAGTYRICLAVFLLSKDEPRLSELWYESMFFETVTMRN